MAQGIQHYNLGEIFEGFLLIKSATKGVASNGQPFLTLQLGDTTGTIDAKVWSATDEDLTTYTNGKVVEVKANIIDYRGVAQLQLQHIQLSDPAKGMSPKDFMEKAPISVETLRYEIDQTIFDMQNATIRSIVRSFIERYNDEFFTYPAAATIHHAFISGLAYHTVTMLRIARSLCDIYSGLNKDLLYAGVILHDIGKIHEFVSETDTTRSRDGNLLGHIPIMASEIKDVASDLDIDKDIEEITLLQHLVLSHHGRPEWGSARTPLIQEAEILHQIDNIDAKMNTLEKALGKTERGTFTEKMFSLDNRSFYKPLI
ncbi:HD domain-containing protein [Salipaludibacillus agaradhaerens]|jgi:3'-5' exoribonuclease|uniref:HD domain-containing protein n=1 Tax=Salipaludibacillus agaradhaerens TaxID=76935 RepID=UPI002150B716|nr:HD domain-containing protein [Salipaludibacillus agaradhaerens]MCR6108591.1 HD domain-containing protein [Salipaludibacillus agaradhaerens]MCR6120620.1 HD domain-containing protein [Salipaludibacillus agaradhaerens]